LKDKADKIKITSSFHLTLRYRIDDQTNEAFQIDSKDSDLFSLNKKSINDIEIESYEDAVQFLKLVTGIKKEIGAYRNKHPNYKFFYNRLVFLQLIDNQ
jgi:hypothetical protein